jgi:membrane-bound ClpP family serine protease
VTPDATPALLLITLGALAVCLEFCRPGLILPGAAGVAAVMLGLARLLRTDCFPCFSGALPAVLGMLLVTLSGFLAIAAWKGYVSKRRI